MFTFLSTVYSVGEQSAASDCKGHDRAATLPGSSPLACEAEEMHSSSAGECVGVSMEACLVHSIHVCVNVNRETLRTTLLHFERGQAGMKPD